MQMQYRPDQAIETNLILWVKDGDNTAWLPFFRHPLYISDAPEQASGFRTMQRLLTKGYTLLPTERDANFNN